MSYCTYNILPRVDSPWSDLLVVHEITNGPFLSTGTIYAAFAPEEGDTDNAAVFQADLVKRVAAIQEAAR